MTLNKLSNVKVYDVVFPTLMLMEIIDRFAEGYSERQNKINIPSSEEDLQKKYAKASSNWNSKLN